VGSHQTPFCDNVVFRRALEFPLCGSRLKPEFCVERVKVEEIPMRFARRRAWAVVTDILEIVPTLYGAALHKLLRGRRRFGQVCDYRGQIENNPMDEDAGRSVRVLADDRQAL